jgi:hypothetical protein
MKPLTAIALASSISLLAACGGDGSSFGQMVTRNQVLSGETAAPPTQVMPTAGTATYRGVASFDFSDDFDGPDIMSEAELTADFASSTISGKLTNFRDHQDNAMIGEVAVHGAPADGGDFGINGSGFKARLNGDVVYQGKMSEVTGNISGAFHGDNADTVEALLYEGFVGDDPVTLGIIRAEGP